MGYLGAQHDALDARVALNCAGPGGCDCACGNCGSGCAYPPHELPLGVGLPHAYYTGGSGDNMLTAATDGLNFSTEIMTAISSADLSQARWTHVGLTDGRTCRFGGGAYRNGGGPGVANRFSDVVDKIPLATDTSSVDNPLLSLRSAGMGIGNQTEGFILGGFEYAAVSLAAERLLYSTGVLSLTTSSLQTGATIGTADYVYEAGETSNDTQGWLLGGVFWNGVLGSPFRRDTVDTVTFATETVALSTSVSSVSRSDIAAAGNADVAIYIGGDASVFPSSEFILTDVMEKITYATDTLASAGATSFKIMDASATGNSTHAYLSGGYLGDVSAAWLADTSSVEYATDTLAAVASATLKSGSRSSMEASGSSYF